MKNTDLDLEIKGLRVPERDPRFWEDFEDRVLKELRTTPANHTPPEPMLQRLAWGFGVALACVVLSISTGQSGLPKRLYHAVVKHEHALSESVRQFPGHVCALMQDEHGMWKVMEDQQ
jgi:hypothetical protein